MHTKPDFQATLKRLSEWETKVEDALIDARGVVNSLEARKKEARAIRGELEAMRAALSKGSRETE